MKVSKTQLKSLIKECLIEILAEGMGGSAANLQESFQSVQRTVQPKSTQQRMTPQRAVAESMRVGQQQQPGHIPQQMRESVQTMRNLSPNKIMADIFADTASTVMKQNANGHFSEGNQGQGGIYERVMADHDPVEIFEDSAKNWAALAFPGSDGPEKS